MYRLIIKLVCNNLRNTINLKRYQIDGKEEKNRGYYSCVVSRM